jgi:hypothetical protein
MSEHGVPADVCADERCGHTRYNHDPSGRTGPVNRCRVDVNYQVPPCPCYRYPISFYFDPEETA